MAKNQDGYLSAKESRRISKENRRITDQYEKRRKRRNVPESEYTTQMKDPANAVEFDNLHTYFFTDTGVVKSVDGVSFEVPIGKTVGVVGVGVTCVNLHHIVQQAHEHDARHIHRLVGIFLQQVRHDSHVPCVFGVVLAAAVAGEMRLPENVLLLVDLENEIQLFLQPFVHKSIFLSI